MALQAGTRLGPYEIVAPIGAGGMGEVYRAVDTQLNRPVAIKVLLLGAVADPERTRRFIQEAQAASALNHPDIVTIYQIGREGTADFIAMELVAGRSLEDAIRGRPLPAADVVRYGMRIAGALAAAHQAGIVHRDLKPANVMVTDKTGPAKSGIKLLDFGVAKLTDRGDQSTMVAPATQTGMVVGTFAYMSPEQAQGLPVDARSDIFSFGVLLHEMATGRRPAGGPGADPLISAPRDLRRIIARCLQPDRDQRFQVMDDVRMALEDVDLAPEAAARTRGRLAPIAGVVALAAAAGAGLAWWMKPVPAAGVPVLTRLTMDSGLTTDPVLSPDGRLIAFASDRAGNGNLDIWVRQVAGGDPAQLTRDPADDVEPSFSPDGSQVVFRSERDGGGVYVVSALGGDARRIADLGRRPRWSPDGAQIVFWTGLNTGFLIAKADAPRVFVVPAAGGEPRRLFADFAVASAPLWSADGRRLLFLGRREAASRPDWWSAVADGTDPVQTGAFAAIAKANLSSTFEGFLLPDAWMPDGRVLFSARQGDAINIWGVRVAADGSVPGAPRRLTGGTSLEVGATVDANGTLAFASVTNDIDLWSLPIDPGTGAAAGPMQRLTQDPANDVFPGLSPDGRSLVFASNRSGAYDVLVKDLATGKDTVIAPKYGYQSLPSFTKDGLRVIFHSGTTHHRWLSVPLASGNRSTAPQLVCDDCDSFWDVSSDGKWVVFGTDEDARIMTRDASGTTTEMMSTPGEIMGRLRISPDDRWIAFNHRKSGSIRINVVPFQPGRPLPRDRWIPLTPEDTMVNAASWAADSGTVYYLSNRDGAFCMWGQRLDRGTGRPLGEPFGVWHFHEARRSMSRIPMPTRGLTVSRDRMVVSVAEAAGNIWLAK